MRSPVKKNGPKSRRTADTPVARFVEQYGAHKLARKLGCSHMTTYAWKWGTQQPGQYAAALVKLSKGALAFASDSLTVVDHSPLPRKERKRT